MRRVLVTHADGPLGRRLLQALYRDPEVSLVLATGTGPAPAFLEPYAGKCVYQRLDLAKARHVMSLFRSERFARARLDSVVHLPFETPAVSARVPGGLPALVSETRRLIDECRRDPGIRRFVLLSSGLVYRPEPGNANLFGEDAEIDFEADDPQIRTLVDVDVLCQKLATDPELCATILRSASIATDSGSFLLSPPLSSDSVPPVGFDPMFSLIADRDVARGITTALHADRPGEYNLAGEEIYPWSVLGEVPPTPFGLPIPGALREVFGTLSSLVASARGTPKGLRARYGVVLDTRRARDLLGFEVAYRVEARGERGHCRIEIIRFR
ncbi:MAG: hypothetical protein ACE5IL_03670 [Myxococcota bacterium]